MRLCDLAPEAEKTPFFNYEITNIVADTRLAREGSLFVARRGFLTDSHELVLDAYRRGARVFLCEREVSLPTDALVIYTASGAKRSAELLARLYGHPERGLTIIGITGTKGKSTVAMMLLHLLEAQNIPSIAVGTLGVVGMDYPHRSDNTTPDAFYLYPLLCEARRKGKRAVILEVSSQALKTHRLHGIELSCAALTSLGIDHIGEGEHKDFYDYLLAKRRLFTSFSVPVAVVNSDCEHSRFLTGGVGKCVYCSVKQSLGLYAENIRADGVGVRFSFRGRSFSLQMAGEFNVMNALIASAVANEVFNIPVDLSLSLLADARVDGRFDAFSHNGRLFVIDYAHNAMSIEALCRTVRERCAGRIICVVGSVGGRSRERRAEIARSAEEGADFTVITEDNPNFEPSIAVCADIYAAFRDKGRARIVTDRREAIKYAVTLCARGDAILLLGKGHERFQRLRGENIPFSEKETVYSLDNNPDIW